jgi:hypothetical protein
VVVVVVVDHDLEREREGRSRPGIRGGGIIGNIMRWKGIENMTALSPTAGAPQGS